MTGESMAPVDPTDGRVAELEAAIHRYEAREASLKAGHAAQLAAVMASPTYRIARLLRKLGRVSEIDKQEATTGSMFEPAVKESTAVPAKRVLAGALYAKTGGRLVDEASTPVVLHDTGRDPSGLPVAIIAGFDRAGRVGPAQAHMGRGLRDAGFYVLLMQDTTLAPATDASGSELGLAFDVVMGCRHGGYDFNSWRLALLHRPALQEASEILLINDSVIGPLFSIRPLIDTVRSLGRDVVGAVEASAPKPHLQSWFLWFGRRPVQSGDLQRHLELWRPGLSKPNLICRMEIALAHNFVRWGYSVAAIGTALELDAHGDNPSIFRWDRLIDLRIPFVKRELFVNHDFRDRIDVEVVLAALATVTPLDCAYLVRESTRQLFPGPERPAQS